MALYTIHLSYGNNFLDKSAITYTKMAMIELQFPFNYGAIIEDFVFVFRLLFSVTHNPLGNYYVLGFRFTILIDNVI